MVIAIRDDAVRIACRPPIHRKESLEPILFQRPADLTDLGDLLQLHSILMFVLSFSVFFKGVSKCVCCVDAMSLSTTAIYLSLKKIEEAKLTYWGRVNQ